MPQNKAASVGVPAPLHPTPSAMVLLNQTIFQAVRTTSGQPSKNVFLTALRAFWWMTGWSGSLRFWASRFQNWMVVSLAIIVIAVLIAKGERD
jgi:hypothetical protein